MLRIAVLGNRFILIVGNWEIGQSALPHVGGVQSRNVTCMRSDNIAKNDDRCVKLVGAKPDISQSCNTQACSGCYYEAGKTYISWETDNYGTHDFPFYGTWVLFYEDGNQIYQTFLTDGQGTKWTVDINGCTYSFGDHVSGDIYSSIYKLCKSC